MRLTRTSVLVIIMLLAIVGSAITVSTADDNNGNPAILAAVQGLAAQVTNLQNSVNALTSPPQANVRFTPQVAQKSPFDDIFCSVVNVTSVTRTVRLQEIDNGVVLFDTGNFSLPAGSEYNVGAPQAVFTAFCKFTVVDGSRTDIRASVWVRTQNGPQVVVPAE